MFFLKKLSILAAKESKVFNLHFSYSSFLLLFFFILCIEKLNRKRKVGGKDLKPSLDAGLQKYLLQGRWDSYQILLSTAAYPEGKKKTTTISSEVPAAVIPASGPSKTSQYLPSLNSGPSAPPEKEQGCSEVQLHTSFQLHFCRNALSSFLYSL